MGCFQPARQLTLLVYLTRLFGSLGRLGPRRSAISFQEPRAQVSLIASKSSIIMMFSIQPHNLISFYPMTADQFL